MNGEKTEVIKLPVEKSGILETASLLGAITLISAFESKSINPIDVVQHMSYFFSS